MSARCNSRGEYGDAVLPGMAILLFGLSELHCEQDDLVSATATPSTRRGAEQFRRASWDTLSTLSCSGAPAASPRRPRWRSGVARAGRAAVCPRRGPNFRPIAAMKVRAWLVQGRLA